MLSSSSNQRKNGSIFKRLSFARRPFSRKKSAASPVSVVDVFDNDDAFLLSKHDGDELDIQETYSSSWSNSMEEEEPLVKSATSLMQEMEQEAEVQMTSLMSSSENDSSTAEMPYETIENQAEDELPVVEERIMKTIATSHQSSTKKNTGSPDVELLEAPKEIQVNTTTSAVQVDNAPTKAESTNKDSPLKVGSRVYIHGGKYKQRYATVERITKVQVRLAIDGIAGSKSIAQKNVRIVVETGNDIDDLEESVTSPLMSSTLKASDEFFPSGEMKTSSPSEATKSPSKYSQENETALLRVGQMVKILKGEHKGKQGEVVKITPKMVDVRIQGVDQPSRKKKTSVEAIPLSTSADSITDEASSAALMLTGDLSGDIVGCNPSEMQSNDGEVGATNASSDNTNGDFSSVFVSIVGGTHKGKSGRVERSTEKTVWVYVESMEKTVRVKRSNTTLDGNNGERSARNVTTFSSIPTSSVSIPGDEWRLPDSATGGTRLGIRRIVKIRTQLGKKQKGQNFLTHLFQDRLMVIETPMNSEEIAEPFEFEIWHGGCRYELISSKIQNDGDEEGGAFWKPKCVQNVYALVEGPLREPYSIKEELARLGDFASLSTRKVVARLELLQSPAYQFTTGTKEAGMYALKKSDFVLFSQESNDGCGFISEEMLESLCSRGGKTFAKRAIAIQVRIVIPKLGVFKGMLMRKRIPSGEPQIQLMPSMQKVGPSQVADGDERAFLWITQAGMNPSKTSLMVARLLDPNAKPPPPSWKPPKKLSDEITRLWQTLNVPEDVCISYAKRSMKARYLQHASVAGVTDPTSSIPAGKIFVTGMKHLSQESLFVTRFPCNLPSDGRILSNVTSKPDEMSESDWIWLNELPFGAIIFSDAEEGIKPLPEQVADGDLDGDRYFVCWNEEIINLIEPVAIDDAASEEEPSASIQKAQPDENWLEKAQHQMIDASRVQEISELIGKLYNLAKSTAASNEKLTADPEAMAFAAAYKQALQHGKHGGTIPLEVHLHEKLPAHLRRHLSCPEF